VNQATESYRSLTKDGWVAFSKKENVMKKYLFLPFLLLALFASQASATIVSGSVDVGTGSFINLGPAFNGTVGNDTFQDPNLYGFDEGQNILISTPLAVNILADGSGSESGSGFLNNVIVASHYIFFDPAGSTSQEGRVLFDSDILGVITSTANLLASDSLISNLVTYLNPGLRGLETGDHANITGLRELSVDWRASTPGDYVRVLTAFSPGASEVPVPAAAFLFAPALLGFMGLRRKAKLAVK